MTKPPADRLTTVGVRLPARDIARLDEARGGISRTSWLRAVLLAAIEAQVPLSKEEPDDGRTQVLDDEDAARLATAGCIHPRARRSKGGLCMACGKNVGEK